MKGTILYGPRDVRFEERDDPKIIKPTDAIRHRHGKTDSGGDTCPAFTARRDQLA